jgi:hypothetical protein
MLSSTHRQTRLVQLNLGASDILRTPELAEKASESQLRGYVMLVDAKLPVIANAAGIVNLAVANLQRLVGATGPAVAAIDELVVMRDHWQSLLTSVRTNIEHLASAVEQEWREKMRYEQEQSRAEQEAISEIERSRRGRSQVRRVGDGVYNGLMMILTVLAVLYAVRSYEQDQPTSSADWLRLLAIMWPVAVAVALLYLLLPAFSLLRRWRQDRSGSSETYSYEFAIRVDEDATVEKINAYINGLPPLPPAQQRDGAEPQRGVPQSKVDGPASTPTVPGFGRPRLVRRANGRIETISSTNFVFKIHSIVVFRVAWLRYARFEVVHEIQAHTVGGGDRYVLLQSRVFGDSPVAIEGPRLVALLRAILDLTVVPIIGSFDSDPLPPLVAAVYDPKALSAARAQPSASTPARPAPLPPTQPGPGRGEGAAVEDHA